MRRKSRRIIKSTKAKEEANEGEVIKIKKKPGRKRAKLAEIEKDDQLIDIKKEEKTISNDKSDSIETSLITFQKIVEKIDKDNENLLDWKELSYIATELANFLKSSKNTLTSFLESLESLKDNFIKPKNGGGETKVFKNIHSDHSKFLTHLNDFYNSFKTSLQTPLASKLEEIKGEQSRVEDDETGESGGEEEEEEDEENLDQDDSSNWTATNQNPKKQTKRTLKRKSGSSSSSNPFKRRRECPELSCAFVCNRQSTLSTHIRVKHENDPTPYHCPLFPTACSSKFKTYYELMTHKRGEGCGGGPTPKGVGLGVSPTKGVSSVGSTGSKSVGGVGSTTKSVIGGGTISSKGGSVGPKWSRVGFSCESEGCGKVFSSEEMREKHIALKHPLLNRILCQYCAKSFESSETGDHKIHENLHESCVVPFSCVVPDCYTSYTNFIDLKKHVAYEHEETSVFCESCPEKIFTNLEALRTHSAAFHSLKPQIIYGCEFDGCEFTTLIKSSVYNHQKTHEGSLLSCEDCGTTYTTKGALKRHQFTHTGENPFKCKYCDKSFNMNHKLKNHEQTHAFVLTYLCSCGRGFKSRKNLTQHSTYHCNGLPRDESNNFGRSRSRANILSRKKVTNEPKINENNEERESENVGENNTESVGVGVVEEIEEGAEVAWVGPAKPKRDDSMSTSGNGQSYTEVVFSDGLLNSEGTIYLHSEDGGVIGEGVELREVLGVGGQIGSVIRMGGDIGSIIDMGGDIGSIIDMGSGLRGEMGNVISMGGEMGNVISMGSEIGHVVEVGSEMDNVIEMGSGINEGEEMGSGIEVGSGINEGGELDNVIEMGSGINVEGEMGSGNNEGSEMGNVMEMENEPNEENEMSNVIEMGSGINVGSVIEVGSGIGRVTVPEFQLVLNGGEIVSEGETYTVLSTDIPIEYIESGSGESMPIYEETLD